MLLPLYAKWHLLTIVSYCHIVRSARPTWQSVRRGSHLGEADPPAGVRANRATSTLTWRHLTQQFARAVLDISVLQADELPAQAESIGA